MDRLFRAGVEASVRIKMGRDLRRMVIIAFCSIFLLGARNSVENTWLDSLLLALTAASSDSRISQSRSSMSFIALCHFIILLPTISLLSATKDSFTIMI